MKIALVVCGMILGALASFALRPIPVQAQSGYVGTVRVERATLGRDYQAVVGFSCVWAGEGGGTQCFVASR